MIQNLVPHESLSADELDDFDSLLIGCGCSEGAACGAIYNEAQTEPLCSCCKRFPLAYDGTRRVKKEYLEEHSCQPPIVECGTLCRCGASCPNRVVGLQPSYVGVETSAKSNGLEVFATLEKGNGLRTQKDITSGTFVCDYAGQVISIAEAAKRTNEFPADTFIFTVREQSGSTGPITTCVDGRWLGNLARFINHSCQPNLRLIPVRVDINIPRLAFFAKEDIAAGIELTVNYGQDMSPTTSLGSTCLSATPCRCGSPVCCKYLPFQADIFLTGEKIN